MSDVDLVAYEAKQSSSNFLSSGREYRLRLVLKGDSGDHVVNMKQLQDTIAAYGASIRAHFGSLLILKIPVNPTANVVSVIKHLHQNSAQYGFTSMHLSVPDSEEVCTRLVFLF